MASSFKLCHWLLVDGDFFDFFYGLRGRRQVHCSTWTCSNGDPCNPRRRRLAALVGRTGLRQAGSYSDADRKASIPPFSKRTYGRLD